MGTVPENGAAPSPAVGGVAAADGSSEEGRVAVLRSLLARVRLDEDRTARAETRASLMALVEPSAAVPVRCCDWFSCRRDVGTFCFVCLAVFTSGPIV